MRISVDSLRVSQDVFDRNEARGCSEGQEPCNICGKATKRINFVHIVNYGNMYTDETNEGEDSLGWHAVGPCCFKKVKNAFGGSYPETEVNGMPKHELVRGGGTVALCDDFCVDNQGICHNCGCTEASHGKDRPVVKVELGAVVIPLVNLNGTSREQLLSDLIDASVALGDAAEAIVRTAPHGRDYQLSGGYKGASDAHEARLAAVREVRHQIELIIEGVEDQG